MKKVLLASTVLAMTATVAAAEVTLSGSARMGIIDNFGSGDNIAFTSRARVVFTLSGETDGGLAFGASFRADNASGANNGTAGSVFISGAFGKLSMGDVDGAALAATGHVDGVGLTGLGDLNELTFIANGGTDTDGGGVEDTSDPSALYQYTAGDIAVYLSVTNPKGIDNISGQEVVAYAVGAAYTMGNYKVSAGYEMTDGSEGLGDTRKQRHWIIGADATFGAVTLKARYGDFSGSTGGVDINAEQYSISATYTQDALSATVFYVDNEDINTQPLPGSGRKAYGIGAAYDLGGGASVKGGYVKNKTDDTNAFDLGVAFSF